MRRKNKKVAFSDTQHNGNVPICTYTATHIEPTTLYNQFPTGTKDEPSPT